MFRLAELFNERKGTSEALEFVDSFTSRLTSLTPCLPPQQRWCTHSRFPDNKAIFDPIFPTYNAALIDRYVLTEGPDPANPLASLERFFNNTLHNSAFPLRIFFITGDPLPREGHGFINYFSRVQNACHLSSPELVTLLYPSASASVQNKLKRAINREDSAFKCYLFKNQDTCALAIHLAGWPDHGVMSLNENDRFFLLFIATLRFPMLLHCAAGVGRSATVLATLLAFQQRLDLINDKDRLLNQFCMLIARIRQLRPLALKNPLQCLLALEWTAKLGIEHDAHQDYFSTPAIYNEKRLDAQLSALYNQRHPRRLLLSSACDFSSQPHLFGSTSTSHSDEETSLVSRSTPSPRLEVFQQMTGGLFASTAQQAAAKTPSPDRPASSPLKRSCSLTASRENLESDGETAQLTSVRAS